MDSIAGISYYLYKCQVLLTSSWWQFCLSARQCTRCILHSTQCNCCSAKLSTLFS